MWCRDGNTIEGDFVPLVRFIILYKHVYINNEIAIAASLNFRLPTAQNPVIPLVIAVIAVTLPKSLVIAMVYRPVAHDRSPGVIGHAGHSAIAIMASATFRRRHLPKESRKLHRTAPGPCPLSYVE